MTDADLANGSSGVITIQMTTPPADTTGMTSPSSVGKLSISSDNGVPVSATIRFSRCGDYKVAA